MPPPTLTRPLRAAPTTAVLGSEHDLSRLQARISVRLEQSALIAAALAAGVAATAAGVRGALAAVLACAVAEVALAVSLAMLHSDRRACVLDLIVAGRGGLPVAAVQAERRRLLARSRRREPARSLRQLADEAQCRPTSPLSSRPLYTPRVLAALAGELNATARRLETDAVGLAGIAMAERLLCAHDSPLYGSDAVRLRQELRRIAFALDRGRDASEPTT